MLGKPDLDAMPMHGIRTFLKSGTIEQKNSIQVLGIPYDSATTFRSGARQGPAAIREASLMLTDGCHPTFHNMVDYNHIWDSGDLAINNAFEVSECHGKIQSYIQTILMPNKNIPLIFGGDHSITRGIIRGIGDSLWNEYEFPISVVHFDAHCDTWFNHGSGYYGHGTWMYNAIQEGFVDASKSVQIGIRSTADLKSGDYFSNKGGTVITPIDFVKRNIDSIVDQIRNVVGNKKCYLTFDIDCLDPAYAPGTGTPEIGGLTTIQAKYLIENLFLDWIGADFVEVAPAYDVSSITSLAAATLAWSWVCQMQSSFQLIRNKNK